MRIAIDMTFAGWTRVYIVFFFFGRLDQTKTYKQNKLLVDFPLTRIVLVIFHYFFYQKEKRKYFNVDFKGSQVFKLPSFCRHDFKVVQKIFKRCRLNDDCYSLHFK